jgi:DNA-directed RNA polymerase alpha subunit
MKSADPLRRERNEEIARLRSEGMTYKAIGSRFGLGVEAVRGIVVRSERHREQVRKSSVYDALSIRALNCLVNHSIDPEDLDQICAKMPSYFLRMPNFGRKSLAEIEEYVASRGRHLGDTATLA